MAEIERFARVFNIDFDDFEMESAADGPWVRHSAHQADKAAELEGMADAAEGAGATGEMLVRRLRERAAEIKEGRDG